MRPTARPVPLLHRAKAAWDGLAPPVRWSLGLTAGLLAWRALRKPRPAPLPPPDPTHPSDIVTRSQTLLPGTNRTLAQWVDRYRMPDQKRSALLGMITHESGARYQGGLTDITHGAGFFEAGVYQFPFGQHGIVSAAHAIGQGDEVTQYKMPRPGVSPDQYPPDFWTSTGGRLLRERGLGAEHWIDAEFQMWAGPQMLARDFAEVRTLNPDLFQHPGSDWWTRALLFAFSGGTEALERAITRHRADLNTAPEDDRWGLIHGDSRWTTQVDAYLIDAARVGYPDV